MAAYVIIKNGAWVNTAEWDSKSQWSLPEGIVAIPFDDGVYGWDVNGITTVRPVSNISLLRWIRRNNSAASLLEKRPKIYGPFNFF